MDEIKEEKRRDYFLPLSILMAALIVAIAWVYTTGKHTAGGVLNSPAKNISQNQLANLEEAIIPSEGIVLPVKWGNLGKQMIEAGVIDAQKFESIYSTRGGLSDEAKNLLYGVSDRNLKITPENSGVVLNLLWALGLGNENEILEKGEMTDSKYNGAGNFASTGGWTIAQGSAMEHYSRHQFIKLTPEQQILVEDVSKNIYRPCCDNSTHFPDCNHGMAMLGLLELMASQGASEYEMYKVALQVNSYWFPDAYLTIARYFGERGVLWEKVNPKEALGADYSSASGLRQILTQVAPSEKKGGGGCGV